MQCTVCFKEEKSFSFSKRFICQECFRQLEVIYKKFKLEEIKIVAFDFNGVACFMQYAIVYQFFKASLVATYKF